MRNYKTVTTEVEVDVFMEEFETEDLVEELKLRGVSIDDTETLTKAWMADREGRKDEAYAILREYMLDKLNKVV
jgi:hypothetical protein